MVKWRSREDGAVEALVEMVHAALEEPVMVYLMVEEPVLFACVHEEMSELVKVEVIHIVLHHLHQKSPVLWAVSQR